MNAGSLDCVRLSPHFARDDNFSVNQHSAAGRVVWQLRGCGNEGLSSLKGLAVVTRQTPDLRPGLSYGGAARLGSPSLHSQENQTKLSHGLLLGELMTVVAAASEVRGKNLAGPVMFPANAG